VRITEIDTHVLVQPAFDTTAASSAQDDIVVEIHTDEGISGIGETDVNPWIARACIEAPGTHNMGLGLAEMLIGADPLDVEGLWEKLYVGSAMNGRRGAVINAIGALDMALHDLRGKAHGKPCHELLGDSVRDHIVPYASLQPETSNFDEYRTSLVDWAERAVAAGFRAVKAEVTLEGPYAHTGLREPWERSTQVLSEVRAAIGPQTALLVDVQYAFPDADTALGVLADWLEFDLFFVETPLWPDDLDGYRRVASEQPIPIAAGEWLTTRFEHLELMKHGEIQVVQPDIGRVGGTALLAQAGQGRHPAGIGRLGHPGQQDQGLVALVPGREQFGQGQHCARVVVLQLEGPAQRGLVASRSQSVGLGLRRGQLGHELPHRGFGQGADEGVDHLAPRDGEHGRDGLHGEAGGHVGVGVDVDLGQLDHPVGRRDHPFEDRAQGAARTAPLGPQVDHHGDDGGAIEDVALEGCVGDVGHRR
jgi:L-alanine-DL-glutamate epimerase-like enolase superfamily enzyme